MKEKELYRRIRHLDLNRKNELVTVTDGAMAGLHVLFTDDRQVWSSGQDFAAVKDQIDPAHIFLERLTQSIQLVVCGCGFVGQSVIRLGKFLGWSVTALDDRREYADMAKEIGADRIECGDFAASLKKIDSGESTCFVIVTREHQYDVECLEQIMGKEFGYVGMMGSRKRADMVRKHLADSGFDSKKAALLHAPVGLSIGAKTPEEIAVSIIAQIMQDRALSQNGSNIPDVMMDALRNLEDSPGHAVMAVVTEKRGSGPRDPGARMIVFSNSRTVGTIGGGLMEAEVIRQAVDILKDPSQFQPGTITVDLSGKKGEPAEMLCGGITKVFLEVL